MQSHSHTEARNHASTHTRTKAHIKFDKKQTNTHTSKEYMVISDTASLSLFCILLVVVV